MQEEIMTIREFCDWLGIGESTYFKWQKDKMGPPIIKIGKRIFISKKIAAKWFNKMRVK